MIGYCSRVTPAGPPSASLPRACSENRIAERLEVSCQAKRMIIDAIGCLPTDRHGADLFFQLIPRRHKKEASILTSNRGFNPGREIGGDPGIAAAPPCRTLHHTTTINIGRAFQIAARLGSRPDTGFSTAS